MTACFSFSQTPATLIKTPLPTASESVTRPYDITREGGQTTQRAVLLTDNDLFYLHFIVSHHGHHSGTDMMAIEGLSFISVQREEKEVEEETSSCLFLYRIPVEWQTSASTPPSS